MKQRTETVLAGVLTLVIFSLLWTTNPVHAAPIGNTPVSVTQPDGVVLHLFASGDEFYNWLHDADGYTILQDRESGYFVYARLEDGRLLPTNLIAGKSDPASAGLRPNLNIAPEKREAIRRAFMQQTQQEAGPINNAPHSGTITNLVIFIRFLGEPEFKTPVSTYSGMLNNSTTDANSLRNYYQEASYSALTVNSILLPRPPGATVVSYLDSHVRGYFQPYNTTANPLGYKGGDTGAERTQREHALLRDAINHVAALRQFPSGTIIDADGDKVVDSLTFIVSGEPTGWSSVLWPHQWVLYTYPVQINDKRVEGYSLHLNSSLNTGVLAHEMFHILGAPDLYHYSYDGKQPVGDWDLMEADANPPQHMGCYMKFKYGGWISSLPQLTSPGLYTLSPLTSPTNNCYKIASPSSASEFFLVEYRRETGSVFESSLPGTGLLVYRINTASTGNASGPPDEVYIYRPGGTISADGNINQANFSSNVGRIRINNVTNPSSFLSNGAAGGLDIDHIGTSSSTISFELGGSTGNTMTFRSAGSHDGWILESTETSNRGGTINSLGTTLLAGDAAGDRQYRSIPSFNTGALPDNALIVSAALKLRAQSTIGTTPFNTHQGLRFDIRGPYFGVSTALQETDFQAAASRMNAGGFSNMPAGGWYAAAPDPTARVSINRAGWTQFRLPFARDDNDDSGNDFVRFYSGDFATASWRPALVIRYYVP